MVNNLDGVSADLEYLCFESDKFVGYKSLVRIISSTLSQARLYHGVLKNANNAHLSIIVNNLDGANATMETFVLGATNG